MNTESASRPVARLLRLGLALVAGAFVAYAAVDIARRWDNSRVTVAPVWLILALIPAFLATLCQAFAWRALLRHWTGVTLPLRSSFRLFFAAQLARYTPGKVGLPAVRMAGAQELGVPKSVMATTLLVETFVWGALGCTVSSALLSLFPGQLLALPAAISKLTLLGVVAGVSGLGLAGLVPREKLPGKVREKLHLEGTGPVVPWSAIGLVLAHWLLWILHGSLLAVALGAALDPRSILVGGALVLAIVIGFFSVLAPAGAGVREAIIGSLAAPVLGAGGALVAALGARAASLGAETLFWALFRSLDTKRK